MGLLLRCVMVLAMVVTSTAAWSAETAAEDPMPAKRVRVELGIGTWISVGDSRWSHNASVISPLGNPTSRLTYADRFGDTNIVEVTAKVSVGPRWFGRLNIGGASIGGGRLTDDDFLTPDGGSPSSRTHSDIDGSGMWYLNADVGARILNFPNGKGMLDGAVGFQYWRQKHEAFGVRQVSCSAAGSTIDLDSTDPALNPLCVSGAMPINGDVQVISNTMTWYSLRTSLHTEYHLVKWLSLHGAVVLKPINIFTNEDTHYLRVPGEFQDPSMTMLGVGFGADADIGARVYVTKALSAQVGYRVWWNRMIDGTWTSHLADGRSSTFPLAEMESLRHGLTAALNYSF